MAEPTSVYYMYPPAESRDAYKIWFDCCLPQITDQTSIYWALDTWARLNAVIEYKEKGPFLTWWSPTGTKHSAYAETFALWFICACRQPLMPTPALAPQPSPPLAESQQIDLSDTENEEILIHADADQIDEKIDKFSASVVAEEDAKPLLQADLEAFLNGWE